MIVVAGVVLMAGCGAAEPAVAPSVPMTTLTLRVNPGLGTVDSRVVYTCPAEDGSITSCDVDGITRSDGTWLEQVTVPTGTVVRMQTSGGGVVLPLCTILDASGKLVLDGNDGQSNECEARAE